MIQYGALPWPIRRVTFRRLIRPIWKYVNETSSRVPLGDWYETLNADYINFRARSVVGGVFMKSLDHYLRNKRK
ncbi:DUF1793 domain-containing protein [Bacteroides salyersiae]|nr:DUF1793 domain-containing protein [Bacteroides salyersiae]